MSSRIAVPAVLLGALVTAIGCGGTEPNSLPQAGTGTTPSDPVTGGPGGIATDPNAADGAAPEGSDARTCEQAAQARAYVGCDFWPTAVANPVWSIFDFAAIVANTSGAPVDVTVTGPSGFRHTQTIAANALGKVYLPWVPSLKQGDMDECGGAPTTNASVIARGGAYHLVTSRPVTVYQFNALEYRGTGGPSGKNWASCAGNRVCEADGEAVGCFSFSNDASLLLPSTAMTGNYRVIGSKSGTYASTYIAITATADGTTVEVKLWTRGGILAGSGIPSRGAGTTATYTLDKGDVIELFAPKPSGAAISDLSGSVITASAPVQVISGVPCITMPDATTPACDHVEESVFPAETLGKDYVVTVPTGPNSTPVGHVVRLVGNVDGTTLSWSRTPTGAPLTLNAGQVVDLGRVNFDFRVTGDKAFGVASLQLGAAIVDPTRDFDAKGDPSMSFPTAVEQYRDSYIFLAPTDYDVNVVDVIFPPAAESSLELDGAQLPGTAATISGSGYMIKRVRLASTAGGTHTITANAPIGIQVIGYGSYTSYQYPGGLNLKHIAPPPLR